MATTTLQPIDDFLRDAENSDSTLELVEGRVREMGSPSSEHQYLALAIGAVLRAKLDLRKSRPSLGHGLVLDEGTARIPDLYVARRSTFASMERRAANYYVGCPEIIIEIVSPTDLAFDIDKKVRQYLAAGAKSVWLVYWTDRHVLVHREGVAATNYEQGDTIVESVLDEELSVPVSELFADLD